MDNRKEGKDESEVIEDIGTDSSKNSLEENKGIASFEKEVTQLSDCVYIYPNKKISDHGNVFLGEIRSAVYGVRVCAIKLARKSEQNVNEAKILTKLSPHTHVVSIIQSGIHEDMLEEHFYIALDKCHKQNLRQHLMHQINTKIAFNLDKALEYSRQIITGLTYVHENLIIHKDLKPSNILLSLDKCTIKIADFGLSQKIKSTSSKIYCKHQFGTNGFRPLESFGGDCASLKSDIFSLGALLYFLLSNGKSPFGDDTTLWIHKTKNGDVDLSDLLVLNRKTFQHLLMLMLSKERCRRPSIWQVVEHPSWTGNDMECDFDYRSTEKFDDYDEQMTPEPNKEDSNYSETEIQCKVLEGLQKMGYGKSTSLISTDSKTSIVIFDGKSKCLRCFNPADKSVTGMQEFNSEMKFASFAAASFEEYIYVLMRQSFYRIKYSEVTATWEKLADLVNNHGVNPRLIVASEAIYVVGSWINWWSKSTSKYHFSRNEWETLKDKQLATNYGTITSMREYVYCIGGYAQGVGTTNRVERLNTFSESWDEIAHLRDPRQGCSAEASKGNIFVIGGTDHDANLVNSVEKYDPDINQWMIMKSTTMPYLGYHFTSHEGNLYLIGGFSAWRTNQQSGNKHTSIAKYDIDRDEWKVVHHLHEEIEVRGCVAVKKKP